MRTVWTFASAGQLHFGAAAVQRVGDCVRSLGVERAFVVTDAALEQAGVVEPVLASLRAAGVDATVFTGGRAEPTLGTVTECVRAARSAAPEAIVGVGGGSNLDVAKLTAVLLTHGGTPRDYLGDSRIPGPSLPVIAVPTTSGTGSEVSLAAAFTDEEQRTKVGMLSEYLRPRFAIVDPLLTLSCPRQVTADSGIDALTHAIEAFTAVANETFPLPAGERSAYQGKHPLGDVLAEKAITLIGQHLRTAVQTGSDVTARTQMALGSTLAGLAFSNVGVALVHALEYPLGGLTHCSHGAGNGLLLPYVLRFNQPYRARELARIAELMGVADAIAAIEQLRADIGIPLRLRDLGVQAQHLPELAARAHSITRIIRVNPRPCTVAELEDILRSAL
jgi:alcohol dehydrogenase class IV